MGSLRVAQTAERALEDVALKAMCDEAGLETYWLTPAEAALKWPGLDLGSPWGAGVISEHGEVTPAVHLEPTGPDDHVSFHGQNGNVHSVLWCPSDGYLQPYDLGMTYLAHARRAGARFETGVAVRGIRVEKVSGSDGVSASRVVAVETSHGVVECERVINAAGAHAYVVHSPCIHALCGTFT